jgi:hypothetical protein
MPISFDEIDGVVQSEYANHPNAQPSARTGGDTKPQTIEQKLREWQAAQRRAARLIAD